MLESDLWTDVRFCSFLRISPTDPGANIEQIVFKSEVMDYFGRYRAAEGGVCENSIHTYRNMLGSVYDGYIVTTNF